MDSRLYLSLINLSDGVEKLINKQKGHCLRISTRVGRRPEETQGGVRVALVLTQAPKYRFLSSFFKHVQV